MTAASQSQSPAGPPTGPRPAPSSGPAAHLLPDGRLHLNHGPIDLILGADGPPAARRAAFAAATARFQTILTELCAELPALRAGDPRPLYGPTAQRMAAAVAPHRPAFITPMAAVAGAVAETILDAMPCPGLSRAYVNNGGDIALHLSPGTAFTLAIAGAPARLAIRHADPVRGVATSGWRGRSFSFGIADAVTVLAPTAAGADAAATMIANAVDLPGHPAIQRRLANQIQCDSDLGARAVTVAVGPLTAAETAEALRRGAAHARNLLARSLIAGAALFLHPHLLTVGAVALTEPTEPDHG